MYISVKSSQNLDKVVKSFEVAYRSVIALTIHTQYPTEELFLGKIESVAQSIQPCSAMLMNKYKAKIDKISANAQELYKIIIDCNKTLETKQFSNKVPYVSDIVDLLVFFFNACFNTLSNGFDSIEDFSRLNVKYIEIRNHLSHPASVNISIEDSKTICLFIRKISANIDDRFFWYVKKGEILDQISSLLDEIDSTPLQYHNLHDIGFKHNKIVERENELILMNNLLFGKYENYRKSGSVVVYGYGGIGKTALVMEFLFRVVKDINDKKIKENIEFICFFSAKEELLSYSETTKILYTKEIHKQISTFEEFTKKLFELLQIHSMAELVVRNGIIVLDNYETLSLSEKEKFYEFIKSTPRSLQFIITSRNEENGEDKVNLTEFSDMKKGTSFITEFIEANNLDVSLTEETIARILQLSKGNTLIIVLCLQMVGNHYSIDNVLNDIDDMETGNIQVISDFMFKNTISQSIDHLQQQQLEPLEVLKVISLYDVPIDLYSIGKLAKISVQSAEKICSYLSTKLILEKRGESYIASEFANKFIISKYLPNHIEIKKLKGLITAHQRFLNEKLTKYNTASVKNPLLKSIMDDWKPKNTIDRIAISEALLFYNDLQAALTKENTSKVNTILREFLRIEKMTSHPYIRFQKARCLQLVLKYTSRRFEKEELISQISAYFEEAIEITDFYYPYIKNTKSYAAINWLYGLFLSKTLKDYYKSIKYLEDSVMIFQRLNIKDNAYFYAINDLTWVYNTMFKKEHNEDFVSELRKLYQEVLSHSSVKQDYKFKFDQYLKQYCEYK